MADGQMMDGSITWLTDGQMDISITDGYVNGITRLIDGQVNGLIAMNR